MNYPDAIGILGFIILLLMLGVLALLKSAGDATDHSFKEEEQEDFYYGDPVEKERFKG